LALFLLATVAAVFSADSPKKGEAGPALPVPNGKNPLNVDALERRNVGGDKAPNFDVRKPVGKGVRSDEDDTDDWDPRIASSSSSSSGHFIDDLTFDGEPELEARNAGGNKAPEFDVRKLVGKGVRSSGLDPGDVDPGPTSSTDISSSDAVDDHHPELEVRNAGGDKAPEFDVRKPVGRGARSETGLDDIPSPTAGGPVTDVVDDHHPELESRNAGGNKAPQFDARKPVGKGARSDSPDGNTDPGTHDDHPEIESRNVVGWKKVI